MTPQQYLIPKKEDDENENKNINYNHTGNKSSTYTLLVMD